ncbi:MAG: hypothetical protein H8E36_02415 [Rhodospirillaceae bacterium]|nr:hypothetical protein [Rhodospirillaceae bacterium]
MNIQIASILLSSSILLAGCQAKVNKDYQAFQVSPDIIGATAVEKTISRNGYGQTEVLSATGKKGVLYSALISANSMGIITVEGQAKRLTLRGWTALKEKQLSYGRHASIKAPKGDIQYEYFSFDGSSCFHFHKLSHRSDNDSMARFRQLMTGYVCHQNEGEFSDETVSQFLHGITVPPVHTVPYVANATPVTLFQPLRIILKNKNRESNCPDSTNC